MRRLALYALTIGIAACSMIKQKQPPHQSRLDSTRETYYVRPGKICKITGTPQLEELTGIRVERADGKVKITGNKSPNETRNCDITDFDLELGHGIGCALDGETLHVAGISGGRLKTVGNHLNVEQEKLEARVVVRITQRGLAEVKTSSIISCGTGSDILIWVPEHGGIYSLESAEGMMLRRIAGLGIPEDRFITIPKEIVDQGILDVVFDGTQIVVRTIQQSWSGGEGLYWERRVEPQEVEWKPIDKKLVLQQ